jgi:hypothetical protein
VAGSRVVRQYLEHDVERETGGRFLFTNDIEEAAQGILAHLDSKRKALNLAPMMYQNGVRSNGSGAFRAVSTYVPPAGLASLGCGKAQERSQLRPPEE